MSGNYSYCERFAYDTTRIVWHTSTIYFGHHSSGPPAEIAVQLLLNHELQLFHASWEYRKICVLGDGVCVYSPKWINGLVKLRTNFCLLSSWNLTNSKMANLPKVLSVHAPLLAMQENHL